MKSKLSGFYVEKILAMSKMYICEMTSFIPASFSRVPLTKFQVLFKFYQFFHICSFPVSYSHIGYWIAWGYIAKSYKYVPLLTLVYSSFLNFPCFSWLLTVFRSPSGTGILQNDSLYGFGMFPDCPGVYIILELYLKGKYFFFHHFPSRIHTINMTYH